MTRNFPTPQVVVYYHHPTAVWIRNLPHGKLCSANVYEMLLLGTGCDFHQNSTIYHGQAFPVIVLFRVNPAEQAKYKDQRLLLTVYLLIFHPSNFLSSQQSVWFSSNSLTNLAIF